MTRKIFYLSAAAVLMLSCHAVKRQAKYAAPDALVSYFNVTLEADSLHNPDETFYKQEITPDELPVYRNRLWEDWKKANTARLSTWPKEAGDSLIWQLPDNRKMLFSLFTKGARPANGYPLFINLHGGGCYPNEPGPWTSRSNSREWQAAKTLGKRYDDAPSLYFVPRMPDDRRGRWYHRSPMAAYIRAWQLGVLSGDVDPDRAYILGISEGGYGSFRMGIFLADYFAAAGPMAGAIWPEQEHIENLRNTAFCIQMGEFDYAYERVENARKWKIKLDSAAAASPGQFIHTVEIQAGKGHGIDYMKAAPWIKQFKRKNYPDTLSWMYYAQCDTIYNAEPGQPCTYRKGFGYVRLDGLSQSGERSFYVEKQGNAYEIKSSNVKGIVKGKITLYVDKVDFAQPVKVNYNGKEVFNKKLPLNVGVMAESIALFGDPRRIFAAAVEVKVD